MLCVSKVCMCVLCVLYILYIDMWYICSICVMCMCNVCKLSVIYVYCVYMYMCSVCVVYMCACVYMCIVCVQVILTVWAHVEASAFFNHSSISFRIFLLHFLFYVYGTHGGQKRASDPLGLELQLVVSRMWLLGAGN